MQLAILIMRYSVDKVFGQQREKRKTTTYKENSSLRCDNAMLSVTIRNILEGKKFQLTKKCLMVNVDNQGHKKKCTVFTCTICALPF